jgi:hypothetical protein
MTTQPLKETPEEMEKRLRAKIKAEQPEDAPPSLDPSSTKVKKADGGMMFYAKMVIVAFIISFLVVTFVATSPLNAQLKIVNTTANSALTNANTAIDNAKKAQASVDSVNASMNAVQGSLQTANADTTSKISAINGQISALQNSIATINNQLKGYATTSQLSGFISSDQLSTANSTIAALQGTIKTLQTQLATDEADIAANQVAIKALQTMTTPTTTPTTAPVSNKVTAVIVPNTFGGGQTMPFAALPNSTSTPNTEAGNFNFTITNSTGATANNIQMAVILEVLAGNGSTNSLVDLTNVSYAATVAINLNGYITSWSQQSTGQIGVLGFTNVIPSGLLANLGTISQVPGTSAPYTVTVTITIVPTSTTTPVPSFTIVPMVKVVSYQ